MLCGEVVDRVCRWLARSGARHSEVIARSSPGRKCPAKELPNSLFTGNAGQGRGSGGRQGGGDRRGQIGCGEENGVTAVGWRVPDSPLNNKMWPGPARNATSAFIVAPVCQECLQPPILYPKVLL